jgi:hypothetical protein
MFKWIIKLIPKFIKTWLVNLLYDDIASKGINGDTELAYLTQQQQNFLKSIGGSGTLNPHTGCKQYFGPLAVGLMVGTAAFGIAKLAGLSTKKALGIGLLGGLGAGGIKALMAAPTSTAMSTGVSQLGTAAGAGSTAAGQAASQLAASTGGGTASFMGGAGATGIGGGAVGSGIGGGGAILAPSGGAFVPIAQGGSGLVAPATGALVPPAMAKPPVPIGEQIERGLGQAGQFVKENPLTTIGGGATLLSLASQPKTPAYGTTAEGPFSEEEYRQAYERQRARVEPFSERAEYERDSDSLTPKNIYDRQEMMYANKGGLSSFREGGVNYLPSKSDHDEKDSNNYVRATGYVEDGSGNGDKDEDTMLAQLADGEFVSRADAVLGAGIMQGANPEDFKDMRRKGAQFFYKQQDQFKRIYDIVNDGNKTS